MKRIILNLSCAFAVLTFYSGVAHSTDLYWVCGNGLWNDGACWSTTPGGPGEAGAPQLTDTANFIQTDSLNRTISSSGDLSIFGLNVDSTGSGKIAVNQTQNDLTVLGGEEYIGINGTGAYRQSGGTNSYGNNMVLGLNPGSSGSY